MSSELALLILRQIDGGSTSIATSIDCDFDAAFSTSLAHDLLRADAEARSLELYLQNMCSRVTDQIKNGTSTLSIIALGVSLLNAFLQLNYAGPSFRPHSLLPEKLLASSSQLHDAVLDSLTVDGERPYALVQAPLYLLLASEILHHAALSEAPFISWFRTRLDFVHQRLLDDTVSTLHNRIFDAEHINRIEDAIVSLEASIKQEMEARWHLELAHIYSHYSYDQKALLHVKKAQRASGIEMQVSGALGRRTKFQTFDVSQLVVLAKSSNTSKTHVDTTQAKARPAQLDLNDDTLLESVSFTREPRRRPEHENLPGIVSETDLPPALAALDPGNQPDLSAIDQCILIAYAGVIKLSAAFDDKLIMEQVAAYVNRVLQTSADGKSQVQPDWTIHTAALLARTRVEGHRSRTVERSVLQLQVLVDQLVEEIGTPAASGNASSAATLPAQASSEAAPVDASKAKVSFLQRADQKASATGAERLRYLFAIPLASKIDLEGELAGKYTSIGLVRSALEIFERIENWEAVAMCYGAMEQEGKAEAVLREQIDSVRPGRNLPKLWCLLGDVLQSLECWQKSWEVSGERYARAQRSIGKYYFGKKEHNLAIEAYSLSLKINPLNHGAWFMYGCSGLETGQYELAAEAFTRCVSIEQQDGESWNNLASALLRIAPQAGSDRRRDAWTALKTATQIKHESWRMWENYMLVSLDVGELSECIRAMRRCIGLRSNECGEAAVDFEVLKLLVQETIGLDAPTDEQTTSEIGSGPGSLRGFPRMVNDLMMQVVQPLITHDPRLWRLLAKLHIWRGKYAEALEANEKAYRCLAGKMVETEYKVFEELTDAADELVDAYRNLGPREGRMGGLVAKDWKFKARSVARTLKGRGQNFEGTAAYEKLEAILEDLKTAS
jgi:tetratricopeptide (TPR) repeat protein